jgi:molecular chaperone GrpE
MTDKMDFQVIDKRHFLELDKLDKSTPAEEKPRYPSFVEELMGRVAEMERKFEEKKKSIDEEVARTKARLGTDFERNLNLEKQKLILPFLEVLDNLERAVENASQDQTAQYTLDGLQMIVDLFRTKLRSLGVESLPVLNQPFDPNTEQAIGVVEVADEKLDGIVVDEVQRGYCVKGQLLRPAQVRVGKQRKIDDL